ncbi:MAG: hypothetical protein ACREH4_06775 [Vitreimonas sp.]
MNVFVLCTGRCGSLTFSKACAHITNYTSGHETRISHIGEERLAYADRHIEIDNRLSWVLGRLDRVYGDSAAYVHLTRDRAAVAKSLRKRSTFGIMKAYKQGVLMKAYQRGALLDPKTRSSDLEIAHDYIETVESNIALFLANKSKVTPVRLETAQEDFPAFWRNIGAEGDMEAAVREWGARYNAS